jgi:hypothetical protein
MAMRPDVVQPRYRRIGVEGQALRVCVKTSYNEVIDPGRDPPIRPPRADEDAVAGHAL